MQSHTHKRPDILVVEDDADMRGLLRNVPLRESCSVVSRADSFRARLPRTEKRDCSPSREV
jgi:CheY-like chemotaxis protein